MAPKFSLRSLLGTSPQRGSHTKPAGASGRAHFNGLIELDELNLDLVGPVGRLKFDEMYWSDPDIRRLVLMCWSPIQAAIWEIAPYGGDEAAPADREAAELVRWALWQAMRPALSGHLAEAGPMLLRMGFCPFEQLWMTAEWNGKLVQVPRKLDMRLPRSIWKWYQDEHGDLTQIVQFLPNAQQALIDADWLTYYRLSPEGDNWEGRSLIRQAYKPWLLKDRLERIDAVGQERKAAGVPIVYPPANTSDETRGEVENVLASMHTSEVAYMIAPGPHVSAFTDRNGEGWLVDVIKFDSSSGKDIQESLRYHREGISGSVLGDFMQLGHNQMGARATAEVQEDPFLTAVRALAEVPKEALQTSLVQRIVDLNCPDVTGYPELTVTIEDEASLAELSAYIEQTVKAGVLHPDEPLEDYVRERADLPPAEQAAREQRKNSEAAAPVLAPPGTPAAPGRGPGYEPKPEAGSGDLDSGLRDAEQRRASKAEDTSGSDGSSVVNRGSSRAKRQTAEG